MLGLHRGSRRVLFASSSLLGGSGLCGGAAGTAIVANAIHRGGVVDDGSVVGVVDHRGVHVGYGGVVVISAAAPFTTGEAHSGITESVSYATIEADMRSPISSVPQITATAPTPITRSPEQSDGRGDYPRARYPEIAVRAIRPITWGPDVARAWADGLGINWQDWRTDVNGDSD